MSRLDKSNFLNLKRVDQYVALLLEKSFLRSSFTRRQQFEMLAKCNP
jgi:hypothetical protein